MLCNSQGDVPGSPSTSLIASGDLVIVYERFDSMKAYDVDASKTYHGRFGLFPVKEWIGKPFGSRVYAKSSAGGQQGWVYILAPTCELWTMVLRHRTQILYAADIAMICTFLELRPGCTVLESGTGSGSLTHALARAIAPTGHVHSFDFHHQRANEAATEFRSHGLGDLVTVRQRNIEEDSFPEELHGKADALFLDLPRPWKVARSAEACLRPDGVFCSFSPCIEQVQRTCEALAACSFTAPRTMECLLRSYEVSNEKMVVDLARAEEALLHARKRKRSGKDGGSGGPKGRKQQTGADNEQAAPEAGEGASAPAALGAAPEQRPAAQQEGDGKEFQVLALPTAEARGHTGYLTFARRLIDPVLVNPPAGASKGTNGTLEA